MKTVQYSCLLAIIIMAASALLIFHEDLYDQYHGYRVSKKYEQTIPGSLIYAADSGNVDAMTELGQYYVYEGIYETGDTHDRKYYNLGMDYLRQAADHGSAMAQMNLADLCENEEEAQELYSKAIINFKLQHNRIAYYFLHRAYARGKGTGPDRNIAEHYYSKYLEECNKLNEYPQPNLNPAN